MWYLLSECSELALRTSIAHSAFSHQSTRYCRFLTGWVSAPGCASATTYQSRHLRWSFLPTARLLRLLPYFAHLSRHHAGPLNSNLSFFLKSHFKAASITSKKWEWACKDLHSFVKIVSLVQHTPLVCHRHIWFRQWVQHNPYDSDSWVNSVSVLALTSS